MDRHLVNLHGPVVADGSLGGPRSPLVGMAGSLRGRWRLGDGMRHVVIVGDSLTARPTSFPQPLRRVIAQDTGEAVHIGTVPMQHIASGSPIGYWSFTGSWGGPSVAADFVSFMPGTLVAPSARSASTVADVATWTPPVGATVAEFAIHYVDGEGDGADAFSYSVDGGAWVDVPLERPAEMTVKRALVEAAVESSVRIRAADADGVDATIPALVGVEPHSSADGIVVHQVGVGGVTAAAYLENLIISALFGGDWPRQPEAWLGMLKPDLTIVSFSNEAGSSTSTNYPPRSALGPIEEMARLALDAGSEVVMMTPPTQAGRRPPNMARLQNFYVEAAERLGVGLINQGEYDFSDPSLWEDGVHQSEAGAMMTAGIIGRYLRAFS